MPDVSPTDAQRPATGRRSPERGLRASGAFRAAGLAGDLRPAAPPVPRQPTPPGAWLTAVGASGLAIWLMATWGPFFAKNAFVPAALAIVLTLIWGRWGPNLLAIALTVPATLWYLVEPIGSFAVSDGGALVRLAITLGMILFGAYIAWKLRRTESEARAREEWLLQSEQRYRMLLEQASDAIVVAEPATGTVLLANSRMHELLGYGRDEMVGRSGAIFFDAEELRAAPIRWAEVERAKVLVTERTLVRKDGSRFHAELASRLTDDGLVQTIVRDISERRAAERQLRAERDLLDGILETSTAAIVVIEPAGRILFANRRAEEILGLSRAQITERDYSAPEWRHTAYDGGPWPDEQQPFRRVISTGEPVFDVRHAIEWPDGTRRYLSVNGIPLRSADGGIRAVVFTVDDLTEEVLAQRALQASQERLEQVTAAMPGVVFQLRWEPEGGYRWTYVSRRAAEILGRTPDQLLAQGEPDWRRVHPDDLPAVRDTMQAALAQFAAWSLEFRTERAPGEWRWLRGSAIPQRDPGGAVTWNGIFLDVTDQKRLEENFLQAQKMESLGRLAGGVAHDFNNILTVIRGNAEMLLAALGEGDLRREEAQEVVRAAERASALTRQLLLLSRKQVVAPAEVALNALVGGIERMLHRVLGEDVTLVTRLDPAVGAVRADLSQLEQVLLNLAVNARDAMPEGGTLTIRTERVARAGGEAAAIIVTDTGVGMDATTAAHIFEPFFTTKPEGKGTGLGLSTVYGIVAQAGGTVTVETAPGRGSTFRVELPAIASGAAGDPAPVSGDPLARVSGRRGEVVLLVEDDDGVRAFARRVLEGRGFRVVEARQGTEALARAAAQAGPLQLLVTDVVMPGMSGRELAQALQPLRPGLRVLYMSGYVREDISALALGDPRHAFLQKPFSADALAIAVEELLARPL